MNQITYILQAEGGRSNISTYLMFGLMFVVFYFFMIRPQHKKQKEAKNFRESIQKGDRVVTIGGIHGKVLEVSDVTVLISVENGKMRVEKSALSASGVTEEREVAINS